MIGLYILNNNLKSILFVYSNGKVTIPTIKREINKYKILGPYQYKPLIVMMVLN